MKFLLFPLLAVTLAASGVSGPASATAAQLGETSRYTILKLAQSPPVLENLDLAAGGAGGASFYEAALARDGKPFGRLHGTILKTDVTPDSSGVETRMRTLVFDLPEGQIVAMGVSEYVPTQVGIVPALRTATRIAIVGGTGTYGAARGEVSTVRNTDGTYDHVLTVLK